MNQREGHDITMTSNTQLARDVSSRGDECCKTVSTKSPVAPRGDADRLFASIESLKQWLGDDVTGDTAKMVGNSQIMHNVFSQARQYARSSAPVLLTGESGTGKEGLARLIHRNSERNDKRYARVNCAALSEGVLESELFGHERGAFTGAIAQRAGRFEWASGGTLLLDEISEIPLPLQAKLLRVLEEAEFQRVGGNKTIVADVRIVATSNRQLHDEVAKGNFRADLYYRVNVLELRVPSLREHKEDIPELALYFLARFRHENRTPITSLSDGTLQVLFDYDWPGNVRELRNALHRACVLAEDGVIRREHVAHLKDVADEPTATADIMGMTLKDAERHLILAALAKHDGNKTAAARDLGVTARTLQNKMQRYRKLGLVA